MKYTLIIGVLSISFASMHGMNEETQSLLPSNAEDATESSLKTNNPPPYCAPSALAYQAELRTTNPAGVIPQGTDTYMTYQEWWNDNDVPRKIREKSVRDQAEWAAQEDANIRRSRAEYVNEKEQGGMYKGAGLAALLCCLLHP
jgi:hypothetical protein